MKKTKANYFLGSGVKIAFIILCCLIPLVCGNPLLEKARYEFDVLKDFKSSQTTLQHLLNTDSNSLMLSEAYFLMAKLYDTQKQTDSSLKYYRLALQDENLNPSFTSYAYSQIIQLSPESVDPHLKNSLSPTDVLVDISEDALLIKNQKGLAFKKLSDSSQWKFPKIDSVLDAKILSSAKSIILVQTVRKIQIYRLTKIIKEIELPELDCQLGNLHDPYMHISCEKSKFSLNTHTFQLKTLPFHSKNISTLYQQGNLILYQISNSLYARNLQDPQNLLWKLDFGNILSWTVYGKYLFTATGDGEVFLHRTQTAEKIWKKNKSAVQLLANRRGLYLFTPYQTMEQWNFSGETKWIYEGIWPQQWSAAVSEKFLYWLDNDGYIYHLNLDFFPYWQATMMGQLKNALKSSTCDDLSQNTARKLQAVEPENGWAWYYRYQCESKAKSTGKSSQEKFRQLIQTAKSSRFPSGSNDFTKKLTKELGAQWIWKRESGTYYHPSLALFDTVLAYQEFGSQSLIYLHTGKGSEIRRDHFTEKLDNRLFMYRKPYLYASTPKKLYQIPFESRGSNPTSLPLSSPICDFEMLDSIAIVSEWDGKIWAFSTTKKQKEAQLWKKDWSKDALYIGSFLDKPTKSSLKSKYMIETLSLKGIYRSLDPYTGKVIRQFQLDSLSPIEFISGHSIFVVGFAEGTLVGYSRENGKRLWKKKLPSQIFSLGSSIFDFNQPISDFKKAYLVVSTANKEIFLLDFLTGKWVGELTSNLPLINWPIPSKSGLWISNSDSTLKFQNYSFSDQWSHRLPGIGGNPALHQNQIFVTTENGFILAFPKLSNR